MANITFLEGGEGRAKRSCNYLLLERTFLGEIIVPEELQGKRVRFKVELIEEVRKDGTKTNRDK